MSYRKRIDVAAGHLYLEGMIGIAQELDDRLRTLDPKRAAQCERLVRDVLSLLEAEVAAPDRTKRKFITHVHASGLMPGIDPTKLGQLADEL